jgi:hypothetical protein
LDWYLALLRRLEIPIHRNFNWIPVRPQVAAQVAARYADAAGE